MPNKAKILISKHSKSSRKIHEQSTHTHCAWNVIAGVKFNFPKHAFKLHECLQHFKIFATDHVFNLTLSQIVHVQYTWNLHAKISSLK